ncbi:MAG TPA: hypothetical protein VKT77_06615 [Chthonomonadaceae bacterium]|nr:hypothetical protein [Chthonomonadaceae bacterium]
MIARITAALKRAFGSDQQSSPAGEWQEDPEKWAEVDFEPIGPAAAADGAAERLLCPVTRQELHPRDRIFRCRVCHTCYSEAGWEFLRTADRGKCCACGSRKSVDPVT